MKSLVVASAIAAASFIPISAATLRQDYPLLSCNHSTGNEEICPCPSFDLHFLIDGTAQAAELEEFWNDSIIHTLTEQMSKGYPGSRVAVSWFRDKPFEPVGASTDTCFSMATDFTESEAALLAVAHARSFTGGTAPGGGDEMYNAQSQAILSAVQFSGLNWRESVLARPYGDPSRTNVIKQVVLVTSTKSHNPHDGFSTVPKLPSMVDNTYIASGNPEDLCRLQDYSDISNTLFFSNKNYYTAFAVLVPYNRPDVISYWQSVGPHPDASPSGFYQVKALVENWEDALADLLRMFIWSAVWTCGQIQNAIPTSPAPTLVTGGTTGGIHTFGSTPTTTRATTATAATTASPAVTTAATESTTGSTRTETTRGDRTDQPPTTSTPPPVSTVLPSATTRTETTRGHRTDQPATTTTGTTTATTAASSTSSTSTSTAVHNGTGHGCCDGIEFKARGRIEEVSMQFKWAQRVKRLLSAVAW